MNITRVVRGASVVRDGSLTKMDILVGGERIVGLTLPDTITPPSSAEVIEVDGLWAPPWRGRRACPPPGARLHP